MALFPTKNPVWQKIYRKGFQKLWVAGALGTFFTAIVRSLPVHYKRWFDPHEVNVNFKFDTVLRYGYLLWLLCYFLVYNIRLEQLKSDIRKRDIWYDVIQSALSLAAAYVMGFVLPDDRYEYQFAYAAANGAIAVICLLAIALFGLPSQQQTDDERRALRGLNWLRGIGLGISGISIGLAIRNEPYWVFLVMLIVLGLLLYFYYRIHLASKDNPINDTR